MLDFNKSDVGFLQAGCRILAGRMVYFYKSDVGCRILTSRMSDGTYELPYPSWLSCVLFEFLYSLEPLFSYFS